MGGVCCFTIRGADGDGAVFIDVKLSTGALLDSADGLATWSDELADLFGVDLDGDDVGCVVIRVLPRSSVLRFTLLYRSWVSC